MKKIRAPNLLVLITCLIFLASLLTYIVPSGSFDLNADGNVIPGTFHFVEKLTVNPIQAFSMILEGMKQSAYIIFVVMLMGGSICAILSHGFIENIISYTIYKLNGKNTLLPVLCCMVMMSLLASVGGSDAFVAFVPVGVVVANKLRLDPIAAVAMFFLPSFVGFFSGPFVMTTQTIAGLEPLSGFFVRTMVLLFMTILTCTYVARYCLRVMKDPSVSLLEDTSWISTDNEEHNVDIVKTLDIRAIFSLLLFLLSFVSMAVLLSLGGLNYNILITILMLLLIVIGLIYKKTFSDIADSFLAGVVKIAGIGLIIGFARTIGLVLEESMILHTLIYYITTPLSYLGAENAVIFLFLSNSVINLFIPSCSGQAAVVLPLMLPIGEILGIPNQVTVSAFTYGDGLTNLCIPTFSALMGALMIAKVPFGKWFRFVFPFILISFAVLSILLMVLTRIGWTG